MSTPENNTPAATPANSLAIGRANGGLMPNSLDDLSRLAGIVFKSGMMPKSLPSPEAVGVAVLMGMEVGLSPMQAVQNIAVINGRPSVWGDAMLGLVQGSGLLEDIKEEAVTEGGGGYRCTVKRKGMSTPTVRQFTMSDAATAKLKGKSGPWSEYPSRMLQMRARSFALRDAFADVLKGLVAREEAQDIPPEPGEYVVERPAPNSEVLRAVSVDGEAVDTETCEVLEGAAAEAPQTAATQPAANGTDKKRGPGF